MTLNINAEIFSSTSKAGIVKSDAVIEVQTSFIHLFV